MSATARAATCLGRMRSPVMLDPPFAGGAVIVGTGDPPTLIVPDRTTYTFVRIR